MLLTVGHIVGPVAGVHDIVVKEREGTLLDGGGSVPALPVTGAACLVGEHTVLPVAVLGALWRLYVPRKKQLKHILANFYIHTLRAYR